MRDSANLSRGAPNSSQQRPFLQLCQSCLRPNEALQGKKYLSYTYWKVVLVFPPALGSQKARPLLSIYHRWFKANWLLIFLLQQIGLSENVAVGRGETVRGGEDRMMVMMVLTMLFTMMMMSGEGSQGGWWMRASLISIENK